jgi:ferredoxin-NADP reductase
MSTDYTTGEGDSAPRTVRVAAIEQLSPDVRGLTLVDSYGEQLPAWQPGAHIDVHLPSGLVRNYSLCGDPANPWSYTIAVLLEPISRGGSAEVHTSLRVGDELKIRGPRNRFPLVAASRYVFVAGGIGITPILPMVAAATAQGIPWRLVYGGRSRSSMAFLDRFSDPSTNVDILPQDEVGLLDIPGLVHPGDDERVYCCGPPGLITAVGEHCAAIDATDRYHFERFTSSTPDRVTNDVTTNRAFEVQLGDGGGVFEVPPDRSILSILLDSGLDVPFSCEEGECGSCEAQLLRGEPDHRDELLTPEERANGSFLICVSRSHCPRLVMDVTTI